MERQEESGERRAERCATTWPLEQEEEQAVIN